MPHASNVKGGAVQLDAHREGSPSGPLALLIDDVLLVRLGSPPSRKRRLTAV
jgi:hypothetical protein